MVWSQRFLVHGLGFGIKGFEFKVNNLKFRDEALVLRFWGLGFSVWRSGCRVVDNRCYERKSVSRINFQFYPVNDAGVFEPKEGQVRDIISHISLRTPTPTCTQFTRVLDDVGGVEGSKAEEQRQNDRDGTALSKLTRRSCP